MQTKAFMRSIFILLVVVSPPVVSAAMTSPDALVKNTTQDVLDVIKTTHDQRTLVRIAESKVVQNFDFERMTRLAVGKSWRKATPDQQRNLTLQFRDLLVRTYANALSNGSQSHSNATLTMLPFHMSSSDTEVTVGTRIAEPSQQPIEVDYRMENTPSGWKVYDVMVDNVSLVVSYKSSFATEVNNSGIDGLIKQLEEKNQTLTNDAESNAR